jgi:hypothetical protein
MATLSEKSKATPPSQEQKAEEEEWRGVQGVQRMTFLKRETKAGLFFNEHLEELPAARFFWADQVQPKHRKMFCTYLGELYELFLSPHRLNIPPYWDLSFLKKYEILQEKDENFTKLPKHLLKILNIEQDNIYAYFQPEIYIQIDNPEVSTSLSHLLRAWYIIMPNKHILTFPLTVTYPNSTVMHTVFFGIKKVQGEKKVKFVYIDPHGFGINPEKDIFKRNIKAAITQHLSSSLQVTAEEVLLSCPALQKPKQGMNCYQWYVFLFALFLTNQPMFEDPRDIITQVGTFPNINVHMFEMSMFLRTMPVFQLKKYYEVTKFGFGIDDDYVDDDTDVRQDDFSDFKGQDCYSVTNIKNCFKPCVRCGKYCNFPSAVQQEPYEYLDVLSGKAHKKANELGVEVQVRDDYCHILSGKEIARKMFTLYILIRELTGQDPRSMTVRQIRNQLLFTDTFGKKVDQIKPLISADELRKREEIYKRRQRKKESNAPKTWRDYMFF